MARLTAMHIGIATVLLVAANFAVLFLITPGTSGAKLVVSGMSVFGALLALLALLRMRSFFLKVNLRWSSHLTLMVAGFALWLVGEALWAYYAVAGRGTPGVTPADAAWFAGYIFVMAGLAQANRETLVAFKPRDTLYAAAFALFALAVAAFVLLPTLSAPAPATEKFFNFAYSAFDIIIAALVLRLAMAFIGSPLGLAWVLFLLGFVVLAFADSWYTSLKLANAYYAGHLFDFVYNCSYILIAAGAVMFEFMSREGLTPSEAGTVEAQKEAKAAPIARVEAAVEAAGLKPAQAGHGEAAVEAAYGKLKGILMQKRLEEAVSITTTLNPSDADLAIMELLAREKAMGGVFLCLDKPYTFFREHLGELGIDEGRIHFVSIGSNGKDGNVSFVEGAGELTSIKMTLEAAVRKMKENGGKAFVLIDCIPTLSLYNDLSHLGRFLHDVSLSLREEGAYQVLLLAPNGEINTFVLRFCDTNVLLA